MWRLLISTCFVLSCATAAEPDAAQVREQLNAYFFDAARHGDVEMLDEFVKSGFDLNTQDAKGYTAVILAAYNGHLPAVEQLLDAGADPCKEDKRGNTALLGAIFKGELRIAKRLMNAACSPDQRNKAGQTPAMYAALFQRTEILEALRESGADMSAQDAMGNSVSTLLKGQVIGAPHAR